MQFASSKACEALSLPDDDIHPITGYSIKDFLVFFELPQDPRSTERPAVQHFPKDH
jgi:hypothetical protein